MKEKANISELDTLTTASWLNQIHLNCVKLKEVLKVC